MFWIFNFFILNLFVIWDLLLLFYLLLTGEIIAPHSCYQFFFPDRDGEASFPRNSSECALVRVAKLFFYHPKIGDRNAEIILQSRNEVLKIRPVAKLWENSRFLRERGRWNHKI